VLKSSKAIALGLHLPSYLWLCKAISMCHFNVASLVAVSVVPVFSCCKKLK
jgi:hypothetical protein